MSEASRPLRRRERLRLEREGRILDAAATVFAHKGFHQATIHDIAELADVADGTIYNYFENKADLLIGLMARLSEVGRLPAELARAVEGDVRQFFCSAFRHRLSRFEQGEEMLKALLPQVFINPDLREQFYRQYLLPIAGLLELYIQAQVERGQIRPVNVPLVTRLVQGMVIGLLVMRILGDEPIHAAWDEVPDLLATIVFDGLKPGDGE